MKVLTTRSHEGNEELAALLRKSGHEPITLDLLSFRRPEDWKPIDARLSRLRDYSWVLLTSATGAQIFSERLAVLRLPKNWEPPPRVGAVGEATAMELRDNGFRVDFVPRAYLTSVLGRELPGSGTVLLLRAKGVDPALSEELRKRGFGVDEVPIYETEGNALTNTELVEEADVVIFGSPSAVEALCSQLSPGVLGRLVRKPSACVGPVTGRAAKAWGFTRIIQPQRHTFDALVEKLAELEQSA